MDQTIQFYLGQKGQPLPIHGIIPISSFEKVQYEYQEKIRNTSRKGNCLLTIKVVKGIRPNK